MKIAVWHNLPHGGGRRALQDHIAGLASRGHTVKIWQPSDVAPLNLRKGIAAELTLVDHHSTYRSDAPSPRGLMRLVAYQQTIATLNRNAAVTASMIHRSGCDVLFANTCRFMGSPFIGRHVEIPSLLYLQEPCRVHYEAMPENPWAAPGRLTRAGNSAHALARRMENAVKVYAYRRKVREEIENARSYHRILVNSCYSRESILRAYGIEASVCYLGVDTELFHMQGSPNRLHMILTVGSVTRLKRIDAVLDALALVRHPRPRYVIVASTYDEDYCRELVRNASRHGIEFELRRNVPDDELVSLLCRAKAVVYAPRLEPFGYGPLEANACATPAIGIDEGGLRETIVNGETGVLVENEPRHIADAIEMLCQDREARERLGARGREYVMERWTLQAANERLAAHLDQIVVRFPAGGR